MYYIFRCSQERCICSLWPHLNFFLYIFLHNCRRRLTVFMSSFFIDCFRSPIVFPICAGPDNTQPRPEEDRHYRQFAPGQETVDRIGQMNSDPDPWGSVLIRIFWVWISIGECVKKHVPDPRLNFDNYGTFLRCLYLHNSVGCGLIHIHC